MGKGHRQTYRSLGRKDTSENRVYANAIASRINADLQHPEMLFDTSLEKYLGVKTSQPDSEELVLTIGEMWELYTNDHLKGKKKSTTQNYEKAYKATLTPFWNYPVNQQTANVIRQVFLEKGGETRRRVLQALNRACNWAVKQEKIVLKGNPFEGISKEIKPQKRVSLITGVPPKYVAYSQEETQIILKAIQQDKFASFYYNCIRFLFSTGCRTGEALALQWKDIDFIRREVYFTKSYDERWGITKRSKNNKTRAFPMNNNLFDWLDSIKPQAQEPNDVCFPGYKSHHIKHARLWSVWGQNANEKNQVKGVVFRLAREGLIFDYLPLYNTRHTFINYCLEHRVDSITIAEWCDNSDHIIQKVYRSKQRNIDLNRQMPSF
jgi:integrase